LDDEEYVEWLYFQHRDFPFYASGWTQPVSESALFDPIDLLRRFPLSPFALKCVGSDLDSEASLYHLLSVFIGCPNVIANVNPYDAGAVIDLVLFACGCIVGHAEGLDVQPFCSYNGPLSSGQCSRANDVAIRYAGTASEWLKEHLPRFAFASSLETMLAQSKDIRYAKSVTA
jgi:hypothetical protein